ncbi:hypothetical protein ACJRPK_10905 [Aquimarina sp. 2-A2]
MKKLVTVLAVGALFVSCEKSELHEETSEIDQYEIHQINRDKIVRPRDKDKS